MAIIASMSNCDGVSAIDKRTRGLAILAARAMHEQRAEDVVVLDLRSLIDYADYFVIGSADSLTRLRGIARRVDRVMANQGARRLNRAERDTGWSLADFGDVLTHVFDRRARDLYRLEGLWGDAPRVEWGAARAGEGA